MRIYPFNDAINDIYNYPIHCNFIFEPGIQFHQGIFNGDLMHKFVGDVIFAPTYTRKKYNNAVAVTTYRAVRFLGCSMFNPAYPINLPCTLDYEGIFKYCTNFNQRVNFPQSLDNDMVLDNNMNLETYRQRNPNNYIGVDYSDAFSHCYRFNQPVTLNSEITVNCANMFNRCNGINASVTFTGNIGHCVDLDWMFAYCNNFNQPFNIPDTVLSNPNSITSCRHMFYQCYNMNSPVLIGNNYRLCDGMFSGCYNFNQPIIIPNTVNSCSYMFFICRNFNSAVSWNDNCVDNTAEMFALCNNFNQNIVPLTYVTNASGMFRNCKNFNRPVIFGNNLKNCYNTFYSCDKLNQSIFVPGTVENISNMFGGDSGYVGAACANMVIDNVTFENLSNVKGDVVDLFCWSQFHHIDLDFSNSSITGACNMLDDIMPYPGALQNHYCDTYINLKFPESMRHVSYSLCQIYDGTWLYNSEPHLIHEFHCTITHANIIIPGDLVFYTNSREPFINAGGSALTGDIRIANFHKDLYYSNRYGGLIGGLRPVYTNVDDWDWWNNSPPYYQIHTDVNTQYINLYTDASVFDLFNISVTLPVVSNVYFNGSSRDWSNYSSDFYSLYPNSSFGYYEDGHLRQWVWIRNSDTSYAWTEIKILLAFDIQILPYTL